jgi:HD superfamily phosphodiesterase
MRVASLSQLVNTAFQFVIWNSKQYNIDESHALKHSMDVYHYATKIYNSEVERHPDLQSQLPIIYSSAILHDMCDKKYMEESDGIGRICSEMKPFMSEDEIGVMSRIITTMSYSKVKKNGYPDLGKHQLAYHIVRESDLLSAYDFERSLVYQMMHEKYNYTDSIQATRNLFQTRILTYRKDDLFITDYSKNKSAFLHAYCENDFREFQGFTEAKP